MIICVYNYDLRDFKRLHKLDGTNCTRCGVNIFDWIAHELTRQQCYER